MLKFEKYQGAGNDFVIVSEKELIEKGIPEYGEFASQVCNRHFGIGADGLIILKYVASMPFMFFFNADGSQAPMCGNGIRCFSHIYSCRKIILFLIIIHPYCQISRNCLHNKFISID